MPADLLQLNSEEVFDLLNLRERDRNKWKAIFNRQRLGEKHCESIIHHSIWIWDVLIPYPNQFVVIINERISFLKNLAEKIETKILIEKTLEEIHCQDGILAEQETQLLILISHLNKQIYQIDSYIRKEKSIIYNFISKLTYQANANVVDGTTTLSVRLCSYK